MVRGFRTKTAVNNLRVDGGDGTRGLIIESVHMGMGQNQWYHFGVGAPPHFSLFQWGLGCSLGLRAFDPWPYGHEPQGNPQVSAHLPGFHLRYLFLTHNHMCLIWNHEDEGEEVQGG